MNSFELLLRWTSRSVMLRPGLIAVPDITMPEPAEALQDALGLCITPAVLSRFLIRFLIREGYSFKKNAGRDRTRAWSWRSRVELVP